MEICKIDILKVVLLINHLISDFNPLTCTPNDTKNASTKF